MPALAGMTPLLPLRYEVRLAAAKLVVLAGQLEEPGAGHEHGTGTRGEQQPAADAGVDFEIAKAAVDRAEPERIDDRHRLEAVLDDEQSADAPQHAGTAARCG